MSNPLYHTFCIGKGAKVAIVIYITIATLAPSSIQNVQKRGLEMSNPLFHTFCIGKGDKVAIVIYNYCEFSPLFHTKCMASGVMKSGLKMQYMLFLLYQMPPYVLRVVISMMRVVQTNATIITIDTIYLYMRDAATYTYTSVIASQIRPYIFWVVISKM